MSTPTGGGHGDGGQPPQLPLPGITPDPGPGRGESRAQMPTTTRSGAQLPQQDPDSLHSSTFREEIFRIVTGRNARGAGRGDPRAEMIAAYGPSQRDPSRPDTREAAKRLGVSQRTVQRWLKAGRVSRGRAPDVHRAARQAMTTKRGRQRALRAAQRAGAHASPGRPNQGLRITGTQGVRSSVVDNYRERDANVGFTDADLAELQQVWAEHGEAGASAFLHQHMDQHYAQEWHMATVDELEWHDSKNY